MTIQLKNKVVTICYVFSVSSLKKSVDVLSK